MIGVTADIRDGQPPPAPKYKTQISRLKAEKIVRQSIFSQPNTEENYNRIFKTHDNSFQNLAKLNSVQNSDKSQ
jgi:hypothetical protein